VNLFDLLAVLVVALAIWGGFRSGAFPQLGGLLGAIAAGILGVTVGVPFLVDALADAEPAIRAIAVLGGLLLVIGLGEVVGSTIGRAVSGALGGGLLGAADRVVGALVGFVQGIFLVWLIGGLLAVGPIPRAAHLAQSSTLVRALHQVVPPPTAFADELTALLDATGLPDVFVGLDPLPADPVPLPENPEAEAIAEPGLDSTGRVAAIACQSELSGTAFVVAPGYLATNAHVVAGARTVRVNVAGDTYDASVVHFDPDLDVAVLRAERLGARPLRFASQDPERGEDGAAIGFPEGGRQQIIPAAVSNSLRAEGRDIYDEHRVVRQILELRAEVQPGDSGGPLMLDDGTVGGMIFAQSKSDPAVGYALTPTVVATTIAPALGTMIPTDTGPCLR
jgi:S1-C subfamily serine protease